MSDAEPFSVKKIRLKITVSEKSQKSRFYKKKEKSIKKYTTWCCRIMIQWALASGNKRSLFIVAANVGHDTRSDVKHRRCESWLMNKTCCGSDRKSGHTREGEGMNAKKWDVYVYGDVNIDIVIPGVEKFPEYGTGRRSFRDGNICRRRRRIIYSRGRQAGTSPGLSGRGGRWLLRRTDPEQISGKAM